MRKKQCDFLLFVNNSDKTSFNNKAFYLVYNYKYYLLQ